ncbi:MAG: hypothetical protein NT007_08210 [Candidatus Kapabacteria bacterium]|nr:hypothetical protein [Candidatus Kapabacteria bacterium]
MKQIEENIESLDDDLLPEYDIDYSKAIRNPYFKMFTEEELIERIRLSEIDIENGDYLTHEQVKQLSKEW